MAEKLNLRKRRQPGALNKQLEDEETTDEEEQKEPTRKRTKPASSSTTRESTVQPSTSNVSDEENGEKDEESSDDDSRESTPLPEQLVPNRARRSTAGNKMAELMKSAAVVADEFYDSAYGGFVEDDVDKNFTSPEHSDADDVDSDFDRLEDEEEEPTSDTEDNEHRKERERNKMLSKNKKWVVARFDKFTVKENSCDAKTQQQRLVEAKKTARENTESLKRFEEVEIERKKRQTKAIPKRALVGPRIVSVSKLSGEDSVSKYVTVPELKAFEKPPQKEHRVCAVTGLPAKYIDPLTELPYANMDAFKQIRDSYKQLLSDLSTNEVTDGIDSETYL